MAGTYIAELTEKLIDLEELIHNYTMNINDLLDEKSFDVHACDYEVALRDHTEAERDAVQAVFDDECSRF